MNPTLWIVFYRDPSRNDKIYLFAGARKATNEDEAISESIARMRGRGKTDDYQRDNLAALQMSEDSVQILIDLEDVCGRLRVPVDERRAFADHLAVVLAKNLASFNC